MVYSHKRGDSQCDQMARLFVQYLTIYSNENLPSYIKKGQNFTNY